MGRRALGLLLLCCLIRVPRLGAEAPPIEFALNEFRQALREKHREGLRIRTEITTAAAESYRVTSHRVQGGDLRGLMYGLLAAADQIRRLGRLAPESGRPAVPIRGIRRFVHNRDLEAGWFYSKDYWRDYIRMLARNRFNRLNLVYAHQTNYLAPPYPYWVQVDEFPEIRAPGLTEGQRQRNLDTLCYIARTAADHAVDFTLGIWQQDIQHGRQTPVVEGLTPENIGPYTYRALKKVLAACPAIRSVQIRTNRESGIPPERQISFYRDYVYKALRESGRLVTLDLRGWLMSKGMLQAAIASGVPLRLSSKYWAEHLGRPYQPAETFPNYSYIDFLRRRPPDADGRPRPYDFFWEIWTLGSHRLLLWGDPAYVRRAAATLTLSDTAGFEIDAPPAQKGFGNRPGKWGIFAAGQQKRRFWKWEFERYWLFYRLWGRITYNPKVSERVWMNELRDRFGEAAADVMAVYRGASRVLTELNAARMPDPNMYIWPEINPGGLIDYYAATPASSRRFVASVREAVDNRLHRRASAKQTPSETAAKLRAMADSIDAALEKTRAAMPKGNREWEGSEPDFQVLSDLARFHSHRLVGAERLTWFYETGDREALDTAETEVKRCLTIWRKLAAFTDGLYPPNMVYGPEDTGHWKDKLPFLEHDLETIAERRWLLDRFGRFEFGFDFGAALEKLRYRQLIHTSVEPRFRAVSPESVYAENAGYGWVTAAERDPVALPDADRETLRGTAHNPRDWPENALFGDSIRGQGAQTFRVRTGEGDYLITFLKPDGSATTQAGTAVNGVLDIRFPEGAWQVSGLLVKSAGAERARGLVVARKREKRPSISHYRPRTVRPGRDLKLTLRVTPARGRTVRLYYRHLNAREKFRELEAPATAATFTIPGGELTLDWDLLYYFEILDPDGSGWFYPDPDKRTPYIVIQPNESPAR